MTTLFEQIERQPDFSRYREQWESGVLAAAIGELASLDNSERKALSRSWLLSSYNGAAFGVYDERDVLHGKIDWVQAGPTQYDCLYTGPYGVKCSLGRVYEQPNGSWAALVIAGVNDDYLQAIGSAEWAITRLCS
ncbi:MAG: hypothetical protein GY797_06280 [Deltaproteobacteria bacterium]|nr:hypothetical protein [Deltaproteobacteria bacterium]